MGRRGKLSKNSTASSGDQRSECCDSIMSDDGNCKDCGNQVDLSTVGREISGDVKFADQFKSPAFQVLVGPAKVAYSLNKQVLIDKMPYFNTMLSGSLKGIETAENTVTLDLPADTVRGFDMAVEYSYCGSYEPSEGASCNEECLLHAQVYVLAERLCMENLKVMALEKMIAVLVKATVGGPFRYDRQMGYEVNSNEHKIDLTALAEVIALVYGNTPEDKTNYSHGKANAEKNEDANDAETMVTRSDKMRVLMCKYTASRLDEIKQCSEILELMKADGDFATDILSVARSGANIENDEMSKL